MFNSLSIDVTPSQQGGKFAGLPEYPHSKFLWLFRHELAYLVAQQETNDPQTLLLLLPNHFLVITKALEHFMPYSFPYEPNTILNVWFPESI